MENNKIKKSSAKAAGLKSAFVVDDNVFLTSFGKGNKAVLETKITSDNSVNRITMKPGIDVSEVNDFDIKLTSSRIKNLSASAQNPTRSSTTDEKAPRQDLLSLKPDLEKYYFGSEFQDNMHIQVIHNILDLEKILAVHSSNTVYAVNNILGTETAEKDDFIGYISTQNTYYNYVNNPKGIKNIERSYTLFNKYKKNPRLAYFGNAFFYAPGKMRSEKEMFHIFGFLGNIRQCCFHGGDDIKLKWLYNFYKEMKGTAREEYLVTLDKLYREAIDRVNKDFIKTNAMNLSIACELITNRKTEEIVRLYYDFIITKTYKNMGFSIKKLRERMFGIPEAAFLKDDKYADIRQKLYQLIDFYIFCFYLGKSERVDDIVARLRASLTEEEKEEIYTTEAGHLWEDQGRRFKNIPYMIKDFIRQGNIEQHKKSEADKLTQQIGDINKIFIMGDAEYFTKLMYLLTLFLDGKEINDLLTTLINKFDNIASILNVMRDMGISAKFLKDFEIFERSEKIVSELRLVCNFARMQKPDPKAKKSMYRDALDILGVPTDMTEDELDRRIDLILNVDENHNKFKGDTGFRNFIASNVINSSRFRYLIRYCNCKKIRSIANNRSAVEFVLGRIPDTQIDRYYISCTGKGESSATREEKLRYLVDLIGNIQFDDFEGVKNNDRKSTMEEKLEKQKFQGIISLYLTVMYLLVKNLVYVNSRYVIGFHCCERDAYHYGIKFGKPEDYREVTRQLCNEGDVSRSRYLANNRRLRICVQQDLDNSDKLYFGRNDAVKLFRNGVAHLSVIRNGDKYIGDIKKIDSYFALYHYIMQRVIMAGCEADGATHEYFKLLTNYHTYVKDMVKALNAPFGYNIPRFKNLSIENLFDKNEVGE